jgi:hypothetical protein
MKKAIKHLLTFIILLGLLSPGPGVGLQARAAGGNPQGGVVVMPPWTIPRAQVCVGDTVYAGVQYKSSGLQADQVWMETDIGNPLSQIWPITRGTRIRLLGGKFTAEYPGQRHVYFTSTVAGPGPNWPVEVLECVYYVRFNATYKETSGVVGFNVFALGAGTFTVKQDSVSGEGTYTVTIKTTYDEDYPDVDCVMQGELQGDSTFTVSGSRSGEEVRISLQFAQMTFAKSPQLECQDENDRKGALDIFSNLTVDPNKDLWLNDLEFPLAGGERTFGFGGQNGTISIVPREKD